MSSVATRVVREPRCTRRTAKHLRAPRGVVVYARPNYPGSSFDPFTSEPPTEHGIGATFTDTIERYEFAQRVVVIIEWHIQQLDSRPSARTALSLRCFRWERWKLYLEYVVVNIHKLDHLERCARRTLPPELQKCCVNLVLRSTTVIFRPLNASLYYDRCTDHGAQA